MTLLVVNDDGSMREPVSPSINPAVYVPFGWWMAAFGEAARCLLAANRATQTLTQLSIALGASAFQQR